MTFDSLRLRHHSLLRHPNFDLICLQRATQYPVKGMEYTHTQ